MRPCIHGNLCRAYWEEKHVYSVKCPNCRFYEPKYIKLQGEVKKRFKRERGGKE